MNLPSFLWLWRIAAWSMGLSLTAYGILAMTGLWMGYLRRDRQPRPDWMRPFHLAMGLILVALVLLLLAVGIVGTLGHYGNLGHSSHLFAGFIVVALVLISAIAALRIDVRHPWARSLHIGTNLLLLVGFIWVTASGWSVVQKYLP